MAAPSKSLLPVLFCILAEMTHPVFVSTSITTMPLPFGCRPCESTGRRGGGETIASALPFSFALKASNEEVCADARESVIRDVMMNSRDLMGLTRTKSANKYYGLTNHLRTHPQHLTSYIGVRRDLEAGIWHRSIASIRVVREIHRNYTYETPYQIEPCDKLGKLRRAECCLAGPSAAQTVQGDQAQRATDRTARNKRKR